MTRHRAHKDDHESSDTEAPGTDNASTATESNGAASGGAAASNGHPKDVTADERMRRAEEMVDQMATRVGEFAGRLGHGLLWLAARAREEAEDIWAEARNISRGERP